MEEHPGLERATGYLELGLYSEVLEELSQLPDPLLLSEAALGLRVEVARQKEHWEDMLIASQTFVTQHPENAGAWVAQAFAARRAHSIDSAEKILLEARPHFPKEAIIPFNLGCYAALLGRLDDARQLVLKAISMDPDCLALARQDPDLIALRDFFRDYLLNRSSL
jgi:tetratricopeptide (TPR) repeat protein